MLERSLVTTKRVLRHMADITEETIKHTQPPAFVICFYTENIGKIDLT